MSSPEQETRSYLLLRLEKELYSVRSDVVREITRWHEPLPIPGAPSVLPGIISQRGVILPTINMHALLGLKETEPSRTTRYVIVQYDEVDMALIVDEVADIINLTANDLQPVPAGLDPQRGRLLQAIAQTNNTPIALLDLGAMITIIRSGG